MFEEVCRVWLAHHSQIEQARNAIQIGSWWSRDGRTEIDVVCANRNRYTLLGSCKWTHKPVGEDALDALLDTRDAITTETAATDAKLALFARRGFTAGLRRRTEREGVLLVTAGELFTS